MPLDLRQHADKHAEVVAELFQHAGLEKYLELSEEDRQTVLLRELKTQRPLYSPFVSYSEESEKGFWRFSKKRARSKKNLVNKPSPKALFPIANARAICWLWRCC